MKKKAWAYFGITSSVALICLALSEPALSQPPGGEPPKECKEFRDTVKQKCEGQGRECFRKEMKNAPEGCDHPRGSHVLKEKCKDALAQCPGEPGPEHFKCLAEKGNAECKAEIKNIQERMKEKGFKRSR